MSFINHDQTEPIISDGEMKDLSDKFLLAIKSRNWDLLRMILTEDCVWRWPGGGPFSGTAVGVDSVIKEISGMADRVIDIRLINVSYGLNGVALSLHFHTKMSGLETDSDLITICILRGYLIAGINTYVSNEDV